MDDPPTSEVKVINTSPSTPIKQAPKCHYDTYVDLIDSPSPEQEILLESSPPSSNQPSIFEAAQQCSSRDCNV
jgi:hypothetical protein